MKTETKYKVGEFVVYPGHGVGIVNEIATKDILGSKTLFYYIKIYDSGMSIMVPAENAHVVGLRKTVSQFEAKRVLMVLKSKPVLHASTWNKRYREYMESIKTGDIFEVAKVLAELRALKVEQELSFGERKMLDTARTLLLRELSVSLNKNAEEISDLMESA